MHLEVQPGRKRLVYVPYCNIKQLYHYFKDAREKERRRCFQIPYHFEEARAQIENFDIDEDEKESKEGEKDVDGEEKKTKKKKVKKEDLEKAKKRVKITVIEQIIVDRRSAKEKELIRLCKKTSTFDQGKWIARPELIL